MKKFNHYIIGLVCLLFFACNDEAILETAEFSTLNCKEIYNELDDIRVDKIGKTQYKYEVINSEKRLVEEVHGSSYTTVYYGYKNDRLHSIRSYDRLTEATTSHVELEYLNGLVNRINHLNFTNDPSYDEISNHTIYTRDAQDRIIESKCFWMNNGVEELSFHDKFEWDDCNLIKKYNYDKNGTLGSVSEYSYDDKVNPYNLDPYLRVYYTFGSSNNVTIIDSKDTNDPNYIHGPSINSGIIEYSYTYNEYGLPTRRRWNDFDKLDYFYTID